MYKTVEKIAFGEGSKVIPTDVKIFIEDGKPYLDYIGIGTTDLGSRIKIHIPKMSLELSSIKSISTEEFTEYPYENIITPFCHYKECFAVDNILYKCQILERDMTKEEVEKELGYKINIKEKY